MGVLQWEYPATGGQGQRGQVISSIVQSGIKLFLHQRNQIPLPLEQLGKHIPRPQPQGIWKRDSHFESDSNKIVDQGQQVDLTQETEDPKLRIQQMMLKRKEVMKYSKGRRKDIKASKQEELAHRTLTDVLQTLNISILNACDHLLAVGLIFGASIQSPKELIVFDIPSIVPCDHPQENSHRPLDMVSLIRSFYRTIIMSSEFVELTSKALTPTRTHICLFSRIELPEDLRQNMILLEKTCFLSQLLIDHNVQNQEQYSSSSSDKSATAATNIQHKSVQPRRKTVKVLRMKFRQNTTSSFGGKGLSKFKKMQVNDVEDKYEFLLESNSFCCYQIPLRFKGVQCKNKG